MEQVGIVVFEQLTSGLLPCFEAYEAYTAAMDVTCGETGAVRLLLGFVYVLALNVLFITLLYFALFAVAFYQSMQIQRLSNQPDGSSNSDKLEKNSTNNRR